MQHVQSHILCTPVAYYPFFETQAIFRIYCLARVGGEPLGYRYY